MSASLLRRTNVPAYALLLRRPLGADGWTDRRGSLTRAGGPGTGQRGLRDGARPPGLLRSGGTLVDRARLCATGPLGAWSSAARQSTNSSRCQTPPKTIAHALSRSFLRGRGAPAAAARRVRLGPAPGAPLPHESMANLFPAMQPDRVRAPTQGIRATPYTQMGLAKVHSDQAAPTTGVVQRSLPIVPTARPLR